jgi:hypothetical protein
LKVKLNIKVGQLWVARIRNTDIQKVSKDYWLYKIVHKETYCGDSYFVGIKQGVSPDHFDAIVFDSYGEEVRFGKLGIECYLTGLSQAKRKR